MDNYAGRVESVYLARAGVEVIGAVTTGTQIIPVGFPADFDENGGTLQHESSGNLYAYSTVDLDADTITLAAPLPVGRAFADGDMLYLWPLSTDARAVVSLSDSADEAPVDARLDHALRPLLAEGARDPGTGESVNVSSTGDGDWVVSDINGSPPVVDRIVNSQGAFFYDGVPALGNLIMSITNEADIDEFGNPYKAGSVFYANDGAFGTFLQMVGGILVSGNAAFPDISHGAFGLGIQSDGKVFIQAGDLGGILILDQAGNVVTPLIVSNNGSSPESWHSLGTLAGATVNKARYRRMPTGMIYVQIDVTFGVLTGTSPNTAITFSNTLPPAYQPLSGDVDVRSPLMGFNNASGALARIFVGKTGGASPGQVQFNAFDKVIGSYSVEFEYPVI